MDYYASHVDVSLAGSYHPPAISGEPPKHWTTFAGPEKWLSERFDSRVAEGSTSRPSATTQALEVAPTSALIDQTRDQETGQRSKQGESDVERIARQRIHVMALRAGEGNRSSELLARLEILNQRITERAPRVTSAQVAALELSVSRLDSLNQAHAERMRRLGL
ncbi:hypothetical protein [Lysobacter soli]|uniref:hypothetical protein n=1 Tax=Lysobacter soli TaxID=453783 RepID=UPI0011C07B17|nr:hypothetical protein [Lysobacter soli]